MANKPKTKNESSNVKRFIKMSINVTKLNKKWFFDGEKGTYANITLMMLPDGEVDKYGNLGMIVQDVPEKLRKADKTLKGEILGNASEMDWDSTAIEGTPGQESGTLRADNASADAEDDLPF